MSYDGTGGPHHQTILRAVRDGLSSRNDIRGTFGGRVAPAMIYAMIGELHQRSYLHIARGGRISLTSKGRDTFAQSEAPPMVPYVPPSRPPLRAGSMDFARLPSVAAGVKQAWRHP